MYSELPPNENVDVSALARIFGRVTNSYKFLFFLALLEQLQKNHFDHEIEIALSDIAIEMLVSAWYPHVYFHLSFGKQDRTTKFLEEIVPQHLITSKQLKPADKLAIENCIQQNTSKKHIDEILRYVPYLLIRPFFQEITEKRDEILQAQVVEFSAKYFTTNRAAPYRFSEKEEGLRVHKVWLNISKPIFPSCEIGPTGIICSTCNLAIRMCLQCR